MADLILRALLDQCVEVLTVLILRLGQLIKSLCIRLKDCLQGIVRLNRRRRQAIETWEDILGIQGRIQQVASVRTNVGGLNFVTCFHVLLSCIEVAQNADHIHINQLAIQI